MDDIKILNQIGLPEVSAKTHIEVKFLRLMVDKKFSKLTRTNTLGFIKILRREYGFDFSSWVSEYDEYLKANGVIIDSFAPAVENTSNIAKKRKKFPWILLLIIAFLVGVYYLKLPIVEEFKSKFISLMPEKTTQNFHEENQSLNQIINEQNTSDLQPSIQEFTSQIENNEELNATLSTQIEPLDANQTEENQTNQSNEINQTNEANSSQISLPEEETILLNEEPKQEAIKSENSYAFLSSKSKMWIGKIDLKNKTRSDTTSKNLKIDLKLEQLFITGHGFALLKLPDGKVKSFKQGGKLYFYVNNGEIQSISQKQFIRYNGGKKW